MFSSGLDKQKKEDWKADGYKWRNNGNKKKPFLLKTQNLLLLRNFSI